MSPPHATPARKLSIVLLLMGCLIGPASGARCAEASGVTLPVLLSSAEPAYQRVVAGLKDSLAKTGVNADCVVEELGRDKGPSGPPVQNAGPDRPQAVVAVGSRALAETATAYPGAAVVAVCVLRETEIRGRPGVTGVHLEHPVKIQFEYLRHFLPKARTVGVLYNPRQNQQTIDSARAVAEGMGLHIEARGVETPQELPAALRSMSGKADVLWGLADTVVLRPETAREFLLFSMRNFVPFIGLSSSWVKAGALYCLEWDYEDLGRQGGEMAVQVLRGTPAGSISPAPPRKLVYSVNLKTADYMKLRLSPEIVQGAQQQF
jgi:putative ABC transport system substrate-binding protein